MTGEANAPPIRLLVGAPATPPPCPIAIPDRAFPTAPVPAAFVPMKFPCTKLLLLFVPVMETPFRPLPEITFPVVTNASFWVPPMILEPEPSMLIPSAPFATPLVPAELVPM
jgi:hypothetical protein